MLVEGFEGRRLTLVLPPVAPKLFPVAYNLIKHFLSENTRQKIYILSGETSMCSNSKAGLWSDPPLTRGGRS